MSMFSGKFGEVFKAEMRTTTVAIKVTKKYSSEKAMCDFQNEMSIMSEVAHHNIVRLYGVISEGVCSTGTCSLLQPSHFIIIIIAGDLSPALVMEFLPLGNLLTFLRVSACRCSYNLFGWVTLQYWTVSRCLLFTHNCE